MINTKKLLTLIIFIFFLDSCDTKSPHVGKWHFGYSKGWFPVTSNSKPVYLDSKRIFINSLSMLVDCKGKSIEIGKKLSIFIDDQDSALIYNSEKNNVLQVIPAKEIFETNQHQIQTGDSFHIDQSLRGSGHELRNQCDKTDTQFRRFSSLTM